MLYWCIYIYTYYNNIPRGSGFRKLYICTINGIHYNNETNTTINLEEYIYIYKKKKIQYVTYNIILDNYNTKNPNITTK